MKIISHTDYSIRVWNNKHIYQYDGVNPFIINKVKGFLSYGAEGKAWALLKKYPMTKEEPCLSQTE